MSVPPTPVEVRKKEKGCFLFEFFSTFLFSFFCFRIFVNLPLFSRLSFSWKLLTRLFTTMLCLSMTPFPSTAMWAIGKSCENIVPFFFVVCCLFAFPVTFAHIIECLLTEITCCKERKRLLCVCLFNFVKSYWGKSELGVFVTCVGRAVEDIGHPTLSIGPNGFHFARLSHSEGHDFPSLKGLLSKKKVSFCFSFPYLLVLFPEFFLFFFFFSCFQSTCKIVSSFWRMQVCVCESCRKIVFWAFFVWAKDEADALQVWSLVHARRFVPENKKKMIGWQKEKQFRSNWGKWHLLQFGRQSRFCVILVNDWGYCGAGQAQGVSRRSGLFWCEHDWAFVGVSFTFF